jgi:sulfotransferase
MKRKYHFIAGLPRSGSTLLSSIFNQNPRFSASITDALISYMRSIIINTDAGSGIRSLVPVEKQRLMIKAIVDAYYSDGNEVCFNTNRAWAAHTNLIEDLYPQSKIILCIRDVPWILDSFEKLHQSTPYDLKAIYGNQDLPTVYHRTNSLIDLHAGGSGLVGTSVLNTKQALFSKQQPMIAVVDYDTLCTQPKAVLQNLYSFLDEPWFEHDFDDVTANYDEYDRALNMKDLHKVRRQVGLIKRTPILPQDLWDRWTAESFWLNDFDHIKQKVLWLGP